MLVVLQQGHLGYEISGNSYEFWPDKTYTVKNYFKNIK